jgi:hypothetical protein
MAKITRVITTPDAAIGEHKVWAGQNKRGEDRASITLHVRDLAGSPELLAILEGQKVTLHFDQDTARLIARDLPETRDAYGAQGIKPAAKSAKLRAA